MTGVADANPDIVFFECDGHHFTLNCFGYYPAHESTAYLMGVAAATLGSKKIGYIGAFQTATFYNDITGARRRPLGQPRRDGAVRQRADVLRPAEGRRGCRRAPLSEGVDFLYGVMDEPTYLQKARRRRGRATGTSTSARPHRRST